MEEANKIFRQKTFWPAGNDNVTVVVLLKFRSFDFLIFVFLHIIKTRNTDEEVRQSPDVEYS